MLQTHFRHLAPFSFTLIHSHHLLRCVSSIATSGNSTESFSLSQSNPTTTTAAASTKSSDPARGTSSWPTSSEFASYNVAFPPTPAQLKYADRFFETSPSKFLRSHAKFRTLPLSSVPEVAFLGRSNVGKSSLLNALLHRTGVKIASISSKPGHTRLMNAFGVGDVQVIGGSQKNPSRLAKRSNTTNSTPPPEHVDHERWEGRGGLVVLDMPGYGHASRKEWGGEIVKYLTARRQLRRTFILVDCQHGLKSSDLHMIDLLTQNGISYQLVLSKIDKILVPSGKLTIDGLINKMPKLSGVAEITRKNLTPEDARTRSRLTDLIMCSSQISVPPGSGKKIGIDNLRWAILSAVGQDVDAQGQKRSITVDMVSQEQTAP